MKKIVIPEGMLEAVYKELQGQQWQPGSILEVGLRWLSEHPIVPDDKSIVEIAIAKERFTEFFERTDWIRWGATEWQRRMFIAPEPELISPNSGVERPIDLSFQCPQDESCALKEPHPLARHYVHFLSERQQIAIGYRKEKT